MKKFLAIIITIATLLSAFVIPMSVSAAEVTKNQTPTAVDISSKMVVIDGKDTEGWTDMDYALIDTYSWANPAVVANPNPSKVRFATDGQYLYIYYVATDRTQFSTKPVLYIYSVFSSEGTGAKQTAVYLDESKSNNFVAGKNATTGGAQAVVVVGESETIAEIRIAIPETEKAAIAKNGSSVKLGIWERYSLNGEPATGDAGMTFNSYWSAGYTLPIPQIDAIEVPTVKRITSGDIFVNGARGTGEGWSEVPYLRLDALGYYGTKPDPDNTPTKVYLSTDSEYLYVLVDSDNRADGDHRIRMAVNFGSGRGNFTVTYYINRTRSHAAPTLNDYSGSDASSFASKWKGETVYTESTNATVTEFAIPLNNAVKSAMLKGDVDMKIGFLEHPILNLGDGGYMPTEGYEWGNTAKVPVTLPVTPIADGETRFVGAQERVTAESSDVRFLAAMGNYEAYECVGFDIVMNDTYESNEEATKCYTVYTSIEAKGETKYAETYGGEYFFAFTLTGLEKSTTYKFDVTSYTKKAGAEKVLGETVTVTVIVGADGAVTFG